MPEPRVVLTADDAALIQHVQTHLRETTGQSAASMLTLLAVPKFRPLIVSVVPPLAGALVGEIARISGAS